MSTQKYDPIDMINETNMRVSSIENRLTNLYEEIFSENDITDQTHRAKCQQLNYQNCLADKFVPYQVCPKCNGTGLITNARFGYGTSPLTIRCDVCDGSKIILMHKVEIHMVDKKRDIKTSTEKLSQQEDDSSEIRKRINKHF